MKFATLIATSALLTGGVVYSAADTTAASRQIDAILAKEWKAAKVQPNKPADDATFLRRVYLDVTGRIPTFEEASAFLNSKAPDKRAKLIDQLLASDGYVHHFFNYWADIHRQRPRGADLSELYPRLAAQEQAV